MKITPISKIDFIYRNIYTIYNLVELWSWVAKGRGFDSHRDQVFSLPVVDTLGV
jgi:hypothetical protein